MITPKTMAEIRDAEAEKYADMAYGDINLKAISALAFIYGFDCRDKIDNEALKLAELRIRELEKENFELKSKYDCEQE